MRDWAVGQAGAGCKTTFILPPHRDVLTVLQIEAEIEEEAKWTGGGAVAPDDDDDEGADAPALFKIDELVCVRDDARGGRHVTQCSPIGVSS